MGLQYNVQVLHQATGVVEGFNGDFPRRHYGYLTLITGQTPESVLENGWSQLVDAKTAQTFLVIVQDPMVPPLSHLEGSLMRLTVA